MLAELVCLALSAKGAGNKPAGSSPLLFTKALQASKPFWQSFQLSGNLGFLPAIGGVALADYRRAWIGGAAALPRQPGRGLG